MSDASDIHELAYDSLIEYARATYRVRALEEAFNLTDDRVTRSEIAGELNRARPLRRAAWLDYQQCFDYTGALYANDLGPSVDPEETLMSDESEVPDLLAGLPESILHLLRQKESER